MGKIRYLTLTFIIIIGLTYTLTSTCFASNNLRIVVDNKELSSSPEPFIENGRILVPVRFVAEMLGAEVEWDDQDRLITINKDDNKVILKIDSYLVIYDEEEKIYGLSDVAPRIIENRTFVPLRLVSNALDVGIIWDSFTRTAYINSNESSEKTPFFDIKLQMENGQEITGKEKLSIEMPEKYNTVGKQVKFLLLDPNTWNGFVIARGNDLYKEYVYTPDIKDNGHKILVAAIYDEKGNFLEGDVVGVNINVVPEVKITGIDEEDILDTIKLGVETNFVATKVEYEVTNLDSNNTFIIGEETPQDPYGIYTWEPKTKENGNYSIKAKVYDTAGEIHVSEATNIVVETSPKISLIGVSNGQTITKPVNLLASRNFDVKNTKYILKDINTGKESVLMEKPYGGYTWFPSPELKGKWQVLVEVEDVNGNTFRSEPVEVNIKDEPVFLLDGIAPNDVLTDTTKLSIRSNVDIENVKYVIKNRDNNREIVLEENIKPSFEAVYTPSEDDIGYWSIKAYGEYDGRIVESDEIPFRVYIGKTYGSVSIVDENNYIDEFIELASSLALDSWEKTGMSAALQVAQSILETGWGRYVPVDKYTGKISYNLFGIKGEGPSGSVIINTREVYNGISYYVDAEFKAYENIEQSWADHKDLLLNSKRYEAFKDVMHNSLQGAWALRRCGYATDPEYAIKIIKIIDKYDLRKLDVVTI